MKKLYELTKFECYELVLKPLFGNKISIDKYKEYGWNVERMINYEWKPELYSPNYLHTTERDKLKEILIKDNAEKKNYNRHNYNKHEDLIEVLYKYGVSDDFRIPQISVKHHDDSIEISIDCFFNYRTVGEPNEYQDEYNNYWVIFYTNGDIKTTYETRREGVMSVYVSHQPYFLSYSQTIQMRKELEEKGVDCVNIHETNFVI